MLTLRVADQIEEDEAVKDSFCFVYFKLSALANLYPLVLSTMSEPYPTASVVPLALSVLDVLL